MICLKNKHVAFLAVEIYQPYGDLLFFIDFPESHIVSYVTANVQTTVYSDDNRNNFKMLS